MRRTICRNSLFFSVLCFVGAVLLASAPADANALRRIVGRGSNNNTTPRTVTAGTATNVKTERSESGSTAQTIGQDQAAPAAEALPDLARQSAKQFQVVSAKEVTAAREAARKALRNLEPQLGRNPTTVEDGWTNFLRIKVLRDVLNRAGATPDEIETAAAPLSADQAGVEWEPIAKVRVAIRNYADLARLHADVKAAETHATSVEELAKNLEEYAKSPNPALALAVGRGLGALRRTRQANALVRAIDARYTHPNLHLEASHKLLASGIDQNVDQESIVFDNVMGVSIRSHVRLTGDLKMDFVPSQQDASMRLLLAGSAYNNSVGHKGPVTVYSSGVTSVSATKDLHFTDFGLLADPADADCSTSTSINGINARCNCIRKMAWRQASNKQGQAEAIASRKAEGRVESQMNRETAELIDKTNESYRQKFRARLARRDQLPRQMQFATTTDRLTLVMLQSGDAHLAAPAAAPAVANARDLNVRLHESFVGNLSEAVVGGTTLTDERLAEMIEDVAGEVPEELQIGPDKEPWSITFAGEHPITVAFTDKNLTIVVNGRRFTRGEGSSKREIRDAARIVATYTVAKTPTGSKLTRQGDLEVEYINIKGTQSATQIAFKTFLRRKFESMFKPEIVSDGIKLQGRWRDAGTLKVEDIQLSPGWVSLGWNLAATDTRTASNN